MKSSQGLTSVRSREVCQPVIPVAIESILDHESILEASVVRINNMQSSFNACVI